jgi:hypothetical protein
MCDGSLYRAILVYFLQELRPWVLQLGLNPTAVELGTVGFLHEPIYNKLASVYNDASNEKLNRIKPTMIFTLCLQYKMMRQPRLIHFRDWQSAKP